MNAVVELTPAPPVQTGQVVTIDQVLLVAYERGAPIEQLERLFALKTQVEADQARKRYNAAFAAFKAEAVRIIKNRTVTDGPLKNKTYAELFAVVNAVTPALSAHGLSASWSIVEDTKEWIKVRCTVRHIDGHSESVELGGAPDAGGAKNGIQARASTLTYLERYTLKAILGVSEQADDDDGGAPPPPPPPQTYDQAAFDTNAPQWLGIIAAGRKTPDDLIAFIESRGKPLTEAQKKTLRETKGA